MLPISKRTRELKHHPIRSLAAYAKRLETEGKDIIYLNIGDPVAYDFDTPNHLKKALIQAVKEGANFYSPSEGLPELREAICTKEKALNKIELASDDIVITQGVSEAIQMVMATIVEAPGEVLVPCPTYPLYTRYIEFFGGRAKIYRTVEENGWQPDIPDLQSKVTDITRAILIINPNNPCGALYDKKTLTDICNIAREHQIAIISDEIYSRLVYEKPFVSTATVADDVPVIGLNGFSKAHLITGWRLGYMYFHDHDKRLSEVKNAIIRQASLRLSSNTPAQKAAIKALTGPEDHIKKMVEKLRERRDYSWRRLNNIDGISCVKPEGAFYIFPKVTRDQRWKNDQAYALDVLKNTGVFIVQGSGFGEPYGSDHVRAVFLPPMKTLRDAFDRLEEFMSQ